MSYYHPTTGYKAEEIEQHLSDVADFINDIPLKHEIIIGADLHAATGIRETSIIDNIMENNEDTINGLIGPHGNTKHNDSGTLIRELLCELDLHAASTYFDSNCKHDMWIHPAMKEGYQPDHFFIL